MLQGKQILCFVLAKTKVESWSLALLVTCRLGKRFVVDVNLIKRIFTIRMDYFKENASQRDLFICVFLEEMLTFLIKTFLFVVTRAVRA